MVLVVYSVQLVSLRVAEVEQLCQVKRMIGGIVNKTREDEREESKREKEKEKERERDRRAREAPRVCIQHVPVCAFKMSPCVPATCPHENFMWACCRYTRGHFERTHGDVLNAHTGFSACHTTTNTTPHTDTHRHTQHAHTNTHTQQQQHNTHPTRTHTTHPTRTHQHAHTQHAHTTQTTPRETEREERRQKTEDRREQKRRRQKTEDRREKRRGQKRRGQEKMKTREKIRRSRDEEKMKLNCLINCPSPKINYYNPAPELSFQKKIN